MKEKSYKTPGITPGATKEEIKRAYQEKMKTYHPDMHPKNPVIGKEQSVTISGRLQMSSTGIKRSMNHINHTITATK